jgi:hypothetical protein
MLDLILGGVLIGAENEFKARGWQFHPFAAKVPSRVVNQSLFSLYAVP